MTRACSCTPTLSGSVCFGLEHALLPSHALLCCMPCSAACFALLHALLCCIFCCIPTFSGRGCFAILHYLHALVCCTLGIAPCFANCSALLCVLCLALLHAVFEFMLCFAACCAHIHAVLCCTPCFAASDASLHPLLRFEMTMLGCYSTGAFGP